ncbi:hypothetical protein BCON_0043g00240 [Botryotinia convoluta]|uniref:Uncharacterized protein n=1 Tax=Botryotinia convoluta TaxID=54673 RepID=A0A4Z1IDZ7_9HELO|nr:hypothetical protein BCON_0043g00240 [Botryotinia convoluta]
MRGRSGLSSRTAGNPLGLFIKEFDVGFGAPTEEKSLIPPPTMTKVPQADEYLRYEGMTNTVGVGDFGLTQKWHF